MNKKILIINTRPNTPKSFFWPLLDELKSRGYEFWLLANDSNWRQYFQNKNWPAKSPTLPFSRNFFRRRSVLIPLYPPYLLFYLGVMLYYRLRKKIELIVCLDQPEKIIFTPWARLLGVKAVWVDCLWPGERESCGLMDKFSRLIAKNSKVITFSELTKNYLTDIGYKNSPITVLKPGVDVNQFRRQENIFDRLANSKQLIRQRKFFTVGTIVDRGERHNIENLYRAAFKCASVISDLQIIIVANEADKKNLTWLARQMEIDNLVWLVGEGANRYKWFESFDVFMVTALCCNITVMDLTIRAMSASLPIIGPEDCGLEDFITDRKNGLLLKKDDSEALAQILIKLKQNPHWRELLGEQAKKTILNEFSLRQAADAWSQILD